MEYEEVDDMSGEQGSYGDGMLNESGEGTNIASPTYSDEEQNDRTGSDLGSPRSPQSPHSPASPGGPASPNEFGDDDSHGPRSPNDEVNGPASPSPESPSGFASPGASPHGSPMSPDGSHRSRSVSPSGDAENRSRSGSPAAVRSRSGSPAGSRSRSRSYSASPRQSQSRSRSGSPVGSRNASPRGSRSGSPIGSPNNFSGRSRSGSRQGSQSRSVSPAGSRSRSRSGSPPRSRSVSPARSRSGSPARSRSRSGSPARSRSGSPARSRSRSGSRARSGSGSVRSRSGSPARSRSGSVRSRSGSPARSRSRSISPARSRSRSRSHSAARSRSGSAHGSPSRDDDEVTGRRKRRDDSDNEGSDKGSEVGELIADIFGSSDEEEFEGFGNAEAEAPSKKEKKKTDEKGDSASVLPDLSDEDDDVGGKRPGDFVSDFDLMLEKKKEEMRSKRKRRKDVDIINDNDDLIDALINRMKQAAEEDREFNQQRKPAVKKLGMLPKVVSQLKKADLQNAFIDGGILNAMTEWLAPLPDKSLPHLQIREAFLKQLLDFPTISNEGLKTSGIGKAVMYLYKHPKELRTNKEMAQKLINEWSRPIFNLTSDLKQLSREEREQRDYEHLPKKRRISLESGATPRRDIDKALTGDDKVLRPGDPGYIYRARVPQPSVKDYVIRPKWNIEEKAKGSSKKQANKYELHMRAQKRKQSSMKQQRAVTMSIEGRNMAL